MITSYFTEEELQNELIKDYQLFFVYMAKRRKYLYQEVKRIRQKSIKRLICWKSPSNNYWWVVERITNKKDEKSAIHGHTYCSYYYHGKLRICNVFFNAKREFCFAHYTYHFFCRLKERLNWKLSSEETAKKFMINNDQTFNYNYLDKMEEGKCPMLSISKFGLEFGFRKEAWPAHYWYTTFIPIEMRKGNQFNFEKFLQQEIDHKLESEPESEHKNLKDYQTDIIKIIEEYQNSSRFKNQERAVVQSAKG
jgi:hypothetical protein